MAELFQKLCKAMENENDITLKNGKPDKHRGEYYIHPYDYWMESSSIEAPGLFLEDVGYSGKGSKIRHLMGKYLDPVKVNEWLEFIEKVCTERPEVRGEIYLPTKVQTKTKGGCLVGFMYRHTGLKGTQPTMVVISRSIEMPAKAMADILLISALSRLICERLGLDGMRVLWYTSSIVMPSRRAYIYLIYKWPEKVKFAHPLYQKYIEDGWKKYYLSDFEFSYSTNIRTKEFFLRKKAGKLEHNLGTEAFLQKLKEYIQ
jgi:hypothetical protein